MKTAAINVLVSAAALFVIALLLEVAVRTVPALLPHGSYGSSRFDPELRTNVHGSAATYNKVRYVVREPNAEGFLDVAHSPERGSPDQVRIAFFGDSYVESLQVRLDQVFHRLLPAHFEDLDVETIGFGISGWGTLHSYLAYQAKAERYDLDVVVYVFVENDLGDNSFAIQRERSGGLTPKAYAELSDAPPGFALRWANPPGDVSIAYRIAKAVQNHSLLARVVWSRLALLRGGGVAIRADDADQEMSGRASGEGAPDQNDLPSTWPPRYREEAEELGRRILRAFRDETRENGHDFAVFYVPRGDAQLAGEIPEADTWLPWLRRTCDALAIPLLDPTDGLRRALRAGAPMYDDHWTPAGHEVVADELAAGLRPLVEARSRRRSSSD